MLVNALWIVIALCSKVGFVDSGGYVNTQWVAEGKRWDCAV